LSANVAGEGRAAALKERTRSWCLAVGTTSLKTKTIRTISGYEPLDYTLLRFHIFQISTFLSKLSYKNIEPKLFPIERFFYHVSWNGIRTDHLRKFLGSRCPGSSQSPGCCKLDTLPGSDLLLD
jgi:hypothetical protein